MNEHRPIGGVVLCGGGSRRMGTDKALLPFGDHSLLSGVVNVVACVVHPTVVVAAAGQSLPDLEQPVEVVRDRAPDRGPLEGLAAGLGCLESRCGAAFVTGCDYPFLSAGFIRFLIEQWEGSEGSQAVVVCSPSPTLRYAKNGAQSRVNKSTHTTRSLYPIPAMYAVGVADRADVLLQSGQRSLQALLESCACTVIDEDRLKDVPGGRANLENVNTMQEYQEALRRLAAD